MRNYFLLAALIAVAGFSQSAAAVERIEEPLTFRHAMNWKSNAVLAFDRLDVDKVVAEDDLNARKGQPLRVAIARTEKTGEHYERQGEWSVIDDMSVWRLKIDAANAEWLSFAFDDIFLPPGAALYVYSENRDQVLGPYTDKDNRPSKKLWTPMVYGEVAYIEINVPTRMKPYLTFDLKDVNHGYRNMKSISTPKVGACNIDVVCSQGNDWRDEIRSVARYVYQNNGASFTCTGNMVNNAVGDRKPYFLTANHCVSTEAEAQSMVVFWNFEKSVCGGSADGSQAQSQMGATLRATVGSLDATDGPQRDMTLLELNSAPPESYNVHWSGWETSAIPPSSGVSIHHPDGTEKRISVDSGPIVITGFGSAIEDPNGTHLMIAAWDEGTTEGGSSGSGFWNSEKRIVGVLSGGGASCDTPDAPDFYAHLASHYDVGTTSTTRLKAWLDPSNAGVTQIDGIDSCDVPNVSFSINLNPAEVNQNITFTSLVTGAAGAGTTYAWDFDGNGSIDSTVASPVFAYPNSYIGNVTLTVTNAQSCIGSASAGIVVTPMGGNTPPNAIATAQATANEGTTVQLDATGSTDADGDNLIYAWIQTAGPVAVLVNASSATPSVTLPAVTADTVVTFEVTVSDSFNASDTDTVSVTTLNVNRAPNALVSNSSLSIDEAGVVTLNASASSDPDGDNLSFAWTQTSGTTVSLSNAATASATFTAPQVSSATTLVFAVTVTDGPGLTDGATVTVTVNDVPPPVTNSGGGGGGALGLPLLALLAFAGYARRTRRVFSSLLVVAGCSLLFACGTAETGSAAADSENSTGVVSTQAAEEGNQVLLFKRGLEKNAAKITNSEHVNQMVSAFEQRERRYEKIKPIFEYEMSIKVDGTSETWMVSPSGYIQKEQSYELYKMDVSVLKDYMK